LRAQRLLVLMTLVGREKAPRIRRPGSAVTDPMTGHGDEPDGSDVQDPLLVPAGIASEPGLLV